MMKAYIVVVRGTGASFAPIVTVNTEFSQIEAQHARIASFKAKVRELSLGSFILGSSPVVMKGEFWTSRLKP